MMFRLLLTVLLGAFALGEAASAAPQPVNLYTVESIRIDATAESATAARDLAMAQGRPVAFAQLFRRLTASSNWSRQPELSDTALLRLLRAFEVSNERRSTTRYLADVTYHFNPAAVRALLRQAGIPFTDTPSRPVVIIPLIEGRPGFDPASPWAMAWSAPSLQQGLVPFIIPELDDAEAALFIEPDLARLDWATLEPLARRHEAAEVVVAVASEDANTVRMIELSPTGRGAYSFAFAQSSFAEDAQAVAERVYETYKARNAIDYTARNTLTAGVQFASLEDWARIRTQLAAVRAISNVSVVGLALNEAEISLTYFGRPEQLRDALAEENLDLVGAGGRFTIQLSRRSAANAP